jgi:hypothetical protein
MSLRIFALLVTALFMTGCIAGPASDDNGSEDHSSTEGPVRGDPVWGDLATAILRPGAPIGWCTYNFLFVDPYGENQTGEPTYYIGTAAHCVEDVGVRMPLAGHGEIGEVVFSSFNETYQEEYGVEEWVDFALVRLDEDLNLQAHPRMMNTDGPTGYAVAADVALGDELIHHGYGLLFGEIEPLRDRPGILVSYDRDFCSESAVWWGDSGSPVLHADTNKALGIVSRAGWFECLPASQLAGATIPYIMDELAKTPFANVTLALADGSLAERVH